MKNILTLESGQALLITALPRGRIDNRESGNGVAHDGHQMPKANSSKDSGQVLVEFALTASIFLFLTLSIMDFGILFSTKLTLQNAVRQAGRYAITGQCITGSNGNCTSTRFNSIVQTLQTVSLGTLNSSNCTGSNAICSIACTNNGGGCPNQAGGPGDIVTITVTYPYPLITAPVSRFFPGGVYTITVSSAFTNEPFPPGSS
jgi:Flp pilus assembly protein TadG